MKLAYLAPVLFLVIFVMPSSGWGGDSKPFESMLQFPNPTNPLIIKRPALTCEEKNDRDLVNCKLANQREEDILNRVQCGVNHEVGEYQCDCEKNKIADECPGGCQWQMSLCNLAVNHKARVLEIQGVVRGPNDYMQDIYDCRAEFRACRAKQAREGNPHVPKDNSVDIPEFYLKH